MYPRVYVRVQFSAHAPQGLLHPARVFRPTMPPAIAVLAAMALMIVLGLGASVCGVIVELTLLDTSSDVAQAKR